MSEKAQQHHLQQKRQAGGRAASDLQLTFSSPPVFEQEVLQSLFRDLRLLAVSLVFILLYMWMCLPSFKHTVAGILSIFLSFPPSLFAYRIVLGEGSEVVGGVCA